MSAPVVIVTGAARGIGAATARLLAGDGYRVLASDVLADEGAATARAISAAGGLIEFAAMDVSDTATVDRVVADAIARHGPPFAIINNAGFVGPHALEDIDDADWSRVIDGNLTSMMRICRAAVPAMRGAGRGRIVCLSSIAGLTRGWPGTIAYSSAKAGIGGFVRTLALELGPHGITVNGIAPAGLHAAASDVPIGRVGTPEDIADAIAFLISDRASFITGQILNVDGGYSVRL